MTEPPALCTETRKRIRELCRRGYLRLDAGAPEQALRQFYQAWLLIPKPQREWAESGWVLTAIGEAYLAQGALAQAHHALSSALHCPGLADNPIVHLRLAEVCLETGNEPAAREHLSTARHAGGEAVIERLSERHRAQLLG